LTYTIEQHIAARRVSEVAAAPDGSWLAVAVQRLDREGAKYVSDLWKVPVDGSPATQLTRGESKDGAPCFRHDGALAFLSNRTPVAVKPDDEADKRMQVWLLPLAGGEPVQLTDEPLGVAAFAFARHVDRLVLLAPVLAGVEPDKQRETATRRAKDGPSARRVLRQPARHWDHWLHDNDDHAFVHVIAYESTRHEGALADGRTDLTPQARREFAVEPQLDVSADGSRVAVKIASVGADREEDSAVAVIDCVTAEARVLGGAPLTNCESPRFSPDGARLAVIRSRRSPTHAPRPQLALIGVKDGTVRDLAGDWDRWPAELAWAPDGKHLFVSADDEGLHPVFEVDVAGGRVRRCTSRSAGGTHEGLVALPDGRVAGIRSTLLEAPEPFVLESGGDAAPRIPARLSGLEAAAFAEVENGAVTSTDGVPIHYFLVKPKRPAGASERLPLLFWIHGGPMGMDADGWHWRWNPLLPVAQGYAVALPNPRGSTGFGQAFVQGIWGNVWGGQCYKDLMAVADALAARPDIDGRRMMAMGGSFGGYMTNWIGTQTDRFRCLITHASVFTMAAFTGVTDHPPSWYIEMGGENPYADPQRFDRYAPVRYVSQWKSPTLVIHGEKDYRCPVGEALNLFEALQYHGVPSELLLFPDENHWILKPRNIVAWYGAVLEFIARHLR
jgi:dipeptidyl aminopeptidase/acylaminoacyl peptidase